MKQNAVKFIGAFLAVTLIFGISFSAVYGAGGGTPVLMKKFTREEIDYGKVFPVSDGFIIYSYNFVKKDVGSLKKFNNNGEKELWWGLEDNPISVKETTNGFVTVAGNEIGDADSTLICYVNKDGKYIRGANISGGRVHTARIADESRIVIVSQSEEFISGDVSDYDKDSPDYTKPYPVDYLGLCIDEFDVNGNEIKSLPLAEKLEIPENYNRIRVSNIVKTGDGYSDYEYILEGCASQITPEFLSKGDYIVPAKMFIAAVSSEGEVLWQQYIYDSKWDPEKFNYIGYESSIGSDRIAILTWDSSLSKQALLRVYDFDGKQLYSKSYSTEYSSISGEVCVADKNVIVYLDETLTDGTEGERKLINLGEGGNVLGETMVDFEDCSAVNIYASPKNETLYVRVAGSQYWLYAYDIKTDAPVSSTSTTTAVSTSSDTVPNPPTDLNGGIAPAVIFIIILGASVFIIKKHKKA